MARARKSKVEKAVDDGVAEAQAKLDDIEGPSPNPMTNLVLTDLLLRGGGPAVIESDDGSNVVTVDFGRKK